MLSDWSELLARISCYVIKINVKYRVFYGVWWLVFVDRGASKGMICDVLCVTAANAIESLSTKLFAVFEVFFCRYFGVFCRVVEP